MGACVREVSTIRIRTPDNLSTQDFSTFRFCDFVWVYSFQNPYSPPAAVAGGCWRAVWSEEQDVASLPRIG